MHLSELIKKLQDLHKEHGDVLVAIDDPETGLCGFDFSAEEEDDAVRAHIVISAETSINMDEQINKDDDGEDEDDEDEK